MMWHLWATTSSVTESKAHTKKAFLCGILLLILGYEKFYSSDKQTAINAMQRRTPHSFTCRFEFSTRKNKEILWGIFRLERKKSEMKKAIKLKVSETLLAFFFRGRIAMAYHFLSAG